MKKNIIVEISRMKEIMGLLNENLETVLTQGKVLKKGSVGEDVKELQQIFKKLGYDLGTFGPNKDGIDGKYGDTMDRVVRDFQDKNGLNVDGKVGKNTLSKLLEVSKESGLTSFIESLGTGKLIELGKEMFDSVFGSSDEKPKNHFVFYFSFPEYEPRYENKTGWFEQALDWVRARTPEGLSSFLGKEGTYGAMGHAGVALINPQGKIYIFEFGRYAGSGKGMGIVKSKVVSGAKIENGVIKNLQDVCSIVKNNAQGHAKDYKMQGVAVPITQEGFSQGISAAKSKAQKPYEIFDFDTGDEDSNCATFGLEIVRTATGSGNEYCLPNPGAGLRVVQTYKGSQTTEC